LWLAAVLGADGPLVDGAVSWRVLRKEGAVETSAFEAQSSEARATLPPGSYTVETTYGLVRKRSTFDVAPGRPTPAIVALDAGGLRFLARAQAGGPTIDQVTYTAYPAEPAAGEPLWIGTDPPSPLGLAPGAYRVVAERGFARSERMVTVAAGAAGDADMTLGAGLLTLKVAAREDGEALPGAVFIVAADDPGHLQGRRELVRSAATEPDFVLPAGSYTVTTRIGDSEARDRIALGAGESVRRTIILGLGRLALSARIEPVAGQAPLREQISFRVMRRDGDAREVARAVSSPQTIELPAGSYRIEAVAGSHNARTVRDVDLQVGRTLQLAMDVPAARLTLKLAEDMGRGEPTWEVRDESNRVVARSNQVEPQLMLAPGRYTIRAAVRDRRGEEEVTLRLGESRTIEVERD
jgi:Ca-activated chloride channel family protein